MFSTTNQPEDKPNIDELRGILREVSEGRRSSAGVARFSDLDRSTIREIWLSIQGLPAEARRALVRQMLDLAESNVALNFSRLLRLSLRDPDSEVRALAIAGLWEDESSSYLSELLDLLDNETELLVREACVEALGRFCYLAAMDDVSDQLAERLREELLTLSESDEPIGLKRRALESVSYFSDDQDVEEAIADAYDTMHHDMRVSALFAMGRNLSDRWFPTLLADMEDADAEIRYEAARASGEYGDSRAVDPLLSLVGDEDREVQFAAIGSLGQIGGRIATEALRRLTRSDDIAIRDAARDALAQATLATDPLRSSP